MYRKNFVIDKLMFLIVSLPFIWFLYVFGPYLIFGVDYREGQGTIVNVNKHKGRIKIEYHHNDLKKVCLILYKLDDLKKLSLFETSRELEIFYSKNFPSCILIKDIDASPPKKAIGSFIRIAFFSLLPLFFKDWYYPAVYK